MNQEKDYIQYDDLGNPELAEWRKKKMKKEIADLDNAEQYVLIAQHNGFYPCFHCSTGRIFLKRGEVWKYGTTIKGQIGRYRKSLAQRELFYEIQFIGNIRDCLIEEKLKIYNYPLLKECLSRKEKLIRPPGNKVDR